MTRGIRVPDEERAPALEVYERDGLAAAHHATGVPRSTLRDWAREAGLEPAAIAHTNREKLEAAHLAQAAYREELRDELRTKLLEASLAATDRALDADQASKDYAPLSVAAGTFLDKYRLEMGEATGREERGTIGDARGAAKTTMDELRAKRVEREAVA